MTRRSWTWEFPALTEIQVAISDVLDEIAEVGEQWCDVREGIGPSMLLRFPDTTIRTTESGYEIILGVPGMKREELELAVSGQQITLSGERKRPDVPDAQATRSERYFGPFKRTLNMSADADLSRIKARLADGYLTIEAPFRGETEQRVEIDVEDV